MHRPSAGEPTFGVRLAQAALERTTHEVTYDGRYRALAYPNGDVPNDQGVCTDLVVRAYRGVGIDLQRLVHEDMRASFSSYPNYWGLTLPDPNIDHRRVPNLRRFFERQGAELPPSADPGDYQPGDVVSWRLPNNLAHIGIVAEAHSRDGTTPLVIHNIGDGPELDDSLFAFQITGHYRFTSH